MSDKKFELTTISGHRLDEVSSAMQKSIRRGLLDEALYWASELDLSGYSEYVWKRLRIICCEDVGLANPNIAVQINSLYQMSSDIRKLEKKNEKTPNSHRLFLVQAVMLLTKSSKNRNVDWTLMCYYKGKRECRYIPDYAIDKHTVKGQIQKKKYKEFIEVGSLLENEVEIHPFYNEKYYKETAIEILNEYDNGADYTTEYEKRNFDKQ